ncbi:ankyrin 2-3/unc44 [Apiospora phragmitis]|uniref:Ankyrin 2-3/unc44 n=1 Tax=Apiospora phragmitis TaxID=2905665 RepID=A0ABR1UUQ0_9PEZI
MYTAIPGDWAANAVGGFKIHDPLRPWTTNFHIVTDILLDSLRKRGISNQFLRGRIGRCIECCNSKSLGYSEDVFRNLQHRVGPSQTQVTPTDEEVVECLRCCQGELMEAHFISPFHQKQDHIGVAVAEYLLRQRKYGVLERVLGNDGPFYRLDEIEFGSVARLLAQHGFARLLEILIGSEYGSKIASIDSGETSSTSADPIFLVAARRELPNMEVIRLLVEKVKVNVNAKSRTGGEMSAANFYGLSLDEDDAVQTGLNTALHELAKGLHWWHVAQVKLPWKWLRLWPRKHLPRRR